MLRLKRLLIGFTVLVSLTATGAAGQTPPATEIYLADLHIAGEEIDVGDPTNITRRPGYDNQPYFLPDGSALLYTAIGEDGQADVYQYTLESRRTVRLTDTPESEYSPTVTPDGQHFSVVRVERDSTQRLWRFPLAGSEPELLLSEVHPIGYHAWIDAETVALFVLGDPITLQIARLPGGGTRTVAQNIGRALHKHPNRRAVTFVHKANEDTWQIQAFDPESDSTITLIGTLEGQEDFAWTPGGHLLMAHDSRLYAWHPAWGRDWRLVADFAPSEIRGITRLAVAPAGDRLALVASE